MSARKIEEGSNIEDNFTAVDESETNDKKAYDTRIENQPFLLGPGTERFLDGKTPLSPLSRAASTEGKFAALDLDSGGPPSKPAYSRKSPTEKKPKKHFISDPNEQLVSDSLCSSPTRKSFGRAVVVFGANDWFNGHLISRLMSEGYRVRFVMNEKNDEVSSIRTDFIGIINAKSQDSSLAIPDHSMDQMKVYRIDASHYFDEITALDELLKGASYVIDNGFLGACGADGGIYNVLRAIQRINSSGTSKIHVKKLLVTISRDPRTKSSETHSRSLFSCSYKKNTALHLTSYCMSSNEVRSEVSRLSKLVGVDAVFISHGQLVGPVFHNAQLNESCANLEWGLYSATAMPDMLRQVSAVNILNPHAHSLVSLVDIRDVTKTYVRCLECPASSDKHYHVAKQPITSLHLWKLTRKAFGEQAYGRLIYFQHIKSIFVPPLWHIIHFDSRKALSGAIKAASYAQEKILHDLGIKLRPSHITIRTMVDEEKIFRRLEKIDRTPQAQPLRSLFICASIAVGTFFVVRYLTQSE